MLNGFGDGGINIPQTQLQRREAKIQFVDAAFVASALEFSGDEGVENFFCKFGLRAAGKAKDIHVVVTAHQVRLFFVEGLTGHIVWEARSTGVINNEQAEWLIRETDATRSLNAFALLANILAEAHRAPQWFLAAVHARAETPEVQAALASRGKLKRDSAAR